MEKRHANALLEARADTKIFLDSMWPCGAQYNKLTESFPLNGVCSYSLWLLINSLSVGEPPKRTMTTTETICITEKPKSKRHQVHSSRTQT